MVARIAIVNSQIRKLELNYHSLVLIKGTNNEERYHTQNGFLYFINRLILYIL
jgi:hypothetical protein